MVDAGPKGDLGRLEGVLGGEMDVQEKDTALVDGPGGSQDGWHPLVNVVAFGTSARNNISI